MRDKIFECIEQHTGGEKFFDALDELIRTDHLFSISLLQLATQRPDYILSLEYNPLIILSGRYGKVYAEGYRKEGFDVLTLEGALRFNEIQKPEQYKKLIKDRYCVFIDDSYFAGRTYQKVKKLIKNFNGVSVGAFVAYDGSKILNPEVQSMFRYYDHFGHEGE